MKWFTGFRPDITPAQIIAGIPIVAKFLAVYGVWSPSPEQQNGLSDLLTWAFVLIGADAAVRIGRNVGDGLANKVTTVVDAKVVPGSGQAGQPLGSPMSPGGGAK